MRSFKIVEKYFPDLSANQTDQFQQLATLYGFWNDRINVISRKDLDSLYIHHVLHSLSIAKFMDFKPGTKILDVGTGGGFPGIPLAILFPEVRFHLVDSIGKKIRVVQDIASQIGLNNVRAEQIRAEQVVGKYHFVVSRAVTKIKPMLNWVRNNISKESINVFGNGLIALKGGDLYDELAEVNCYYENVPIKGYFEEPFFETKSIIYVPLK